MPMYPPPEATMGAYGDVVPDRRSYRPLESVTVRINGRARGDEASPPNAAGANATATHKDRISLIRRILRCRMGNLLR